MANNIANFIHMKITGLLLGLIFMVGCNQQPDSVRPRLDLSGTWQFSVDLDDKGVEEQWFLLDLADSILLPGTTDSNQKGTVNNDTTTLHLNRVYTYEGPAWYRKQVLIPEAWRDKAIRLVLERTKTSQVWVDNQHASTSGLLQSAQEYDLSGFLTPGKHTITIRVDNSLELTPFGNVHIYTDETQTNWNGIIGGVFLEASPKTFIEGVQVFPDVENRKVQINIDVNNGLALKEAEVQLHVSKELDGEIRKLKVSKHKISCESVVQLVYDLGDQMELWDEFRQPLYHLNVVLVADTIRDHQDVSFGMRQFKTKESQFVINGRATFLRGKHDACVFPLTGHPPMNVEGWTDYFQTIKDYGLNHCRFHTWCPPEAAFEAADRLGIYLQPELPFWGGLDQDSIAEVLYKEGLAMLKKYANHPSFVMFSPGNEIWSGHERIKQLIEKLKAFDNRLLFTQGSNNNIGYVGPMEGTDFHIAARTPYAHDTTLTHTRLTQSFADANAGGILNSQTPSTRVNFSYAVEQIGMPLISHEMGQYQIYPDYREIAKYTGVVQARNLEVFKNRLEKAGMPDQNQAFQQASGAWSALCYKAEMEAALRTVGMGGFQLLDLQDFPGQGTALVGILDAFMDSKGVIRRETWLQSCNDVVILPEFDKYCWTNAETFSAEIKIANYSNGAITSPLHWWVVGPDSIRLQQGKIESVSVPEGGVSLLGTIEFPLSGIDEARQFTLRFWLEGTGYSNAYPLWVYPAHLNPQADPGILVTRSMSQMVLEQLYQGKKVLLMPDEQWVGKNSTEGLFPPDFWNYGMFKSISEGAGRPVSPGTLGLLTDPDHPLFNAFPTNSHTNWQWFSIIKASRPLILDATGKNYRPIVQVIDNMERNHKLGLIFEFKVGAGKLLVCMANLESIKDKPEAAQLYQSIFNYMASDRFNPQEVADAALLEELFLK